MQRKTRCDPGLPRCGPCERTNSHCEYYDPTKGRKIPATTSCACSTRCASWRSSWPTSRETTSSPMPRTSCAAPPPCASRTRTSPSSWGPRAASPSRAWSCSWPSSSPRARRYQRSCPTPAKSPSRPPSSRRTSGPRPRCTPWSATWRLRSCPIETSPIC